MLFFFLFFGQLRELYFNMWGEKYADSKNVIPGGIQSRNLCLERLKVQLFFLRPCSKVVIYTMKFHFNNILWQMKRMKLLSSF